MNALLLLFVLLWEKSGQKQRIGSLLRYAPKTKYVAKINNPSAVLFMTQGFKRAKHKKRALLIFLGIILAITGVFFIPM